MIASEGQHVLLRAQNHWIHYDRFYLEQSTIKHKSAGGHRTASSGLGPDVGRKGPEFQRSSKHRLSR